MVTTTSATAAKSAPSLITASATTRWLPASRTRESISTFGGGEGNSNTAISGTGLTSEYRWIDLSTEPGANGPAIVSRIGTACPLSASAGSSRRRCSQRGERPAKNDASAGMAGICCATAAGAAAKSGLASAHAPALCSKRRRDMGLRESRAFIAPSSSQCRKIGNDIFDLFRVENRLAAVSARHLVEALDAIVARHDGGGVDAHVVDDPQAQLRDGKRSRNAAEWRAKITQEAQTRFRNRVAQHAIGRFAAEDQGPPALGIARGAADRFRNAVGNHAELGEISGFASGGGRSLSPTRRGRAGMSGDQS